MKARDPYHLAVAALTDFASEGRFGWGRPLVATALAVALKLALIHLAEGFIRWREDGVGAFATQFFRITRRFQQRVLT